MSMEMYNALVEVDRQAMLGGDVDKVDQVMDRLEGFHAVLSGSPRGWALAQISLPAESLQQAAVLAAGVVGAAFGATPIACEVMTETEFLAREGWAPVPELVSVTEAAQLLGVSRQRVLQRIANNTLPSTRIGRDHAIPRSALGDEVGGPPGGPV